MKKTLLLLVLFLLLTGCISVKGLLAPGTAPLEEQVVSGEGKGKILVVDISGILVMDRLGPDFFSKRDPVLSRLREELDLARQDNKIVGLLLRIDSSGGSVTASDILYHEIFRFGQERQLPVVALVLDKALSGGYYVALAADEIIVHPTSVVGGVGVVALKFNLAGLLEKWGIADDSVKSGEYKDFWSPLRASSPEETALMQGITDRLHQRFIDLVAERRGIKDCTLKQVAKGTLFDAKPAQALRLVDSLGYFEDAIGRVRQLAGVEKARVILYRRAGANAGSIYAAGNPILHTMMRLEGIAEEMTGPSFRYQVAP
ncbi:MAG: signal peptide peptidase SppA [Desulfuromonadales bacterium]